MDKEELLSELNDQTAEDLEVYITSDSMWSPILNFTEEYGVKEDYRETDFIKFLRRVKKENSDNYALFSYYSLKNLAEALELNMRWKLVRRKADLKKPSDREQQKPTLSADQVKKMVKVEKENGYDYEKFFLSLSTAFGCRRIELSKVKEKDIFKNRILIRTGKGGEIREQYLPNEIRPIVHGFKFGDKNFTVNVLSDVFHDIREKAGIDREERMGWHCVPPETTLLTLGGHKKIKDIEIGDVVSAGYDFTEVTDTFVHNYSGDLIKIDTHGLLPIYVTSNHPLLIGSIKTEYDSNLDGKHYKRRPQNTHWKKASELTPTNMKWLNGEMTPSTQKRERGRWVPCADLPSSEYLVVPKLNIDETGQKAFNIEKYIKKCGRNDPKQPIENGLELTPQIAKFIGKYSADGSGSKGQSALYFNHKSERNEFKEYKDIIENDIGYLTRRQVRETRGELHGEEIKGKSLNLLFGGEVIRRFFLDKIKRNSSDVWVPKEIFFSPDDVVKSFTFGYFDGDGYVSKDRQCVTASSICRGFLLQLQHLLTRLNVFSTISSPPSTNRTFLRMNQNNANKVLDCDYSVGISRGSPIIEDENNFYTPIKSVERVPYEGMVYNIETEEGSYTINNALTHNSVRRAVVSEFRNNISQSDEIMEGDLFKFMRWQPNDRVKEMLSIYDNSDPIEADKRMFELHPFVRYWGD